MIFNTIFWCFFVTIFPSQITATAIKNVSLPLSEPELWSLRANETIRISLQKDVVASHIFWTFEAHSQNNDDQIIFAKTPSINHGMGTNIVLTVVFRVTLKSQGSRSPLNRLLLVFYQKLITRSEIRYTYFGL